MNFVVKKREKRVKVGMPTKDYSRSVRMTHEGFDPEKIKLRIVKNKFEHQKYDPSIYSEEF